MGNVEYTIDVASRRQMLEARRAQAEVEHYQHSLNAKVARAQPSTVEGRAQAIKASEDQAAAIEVGLKVYNEELEALAALAEDEDKDEESDVAAPATPQTALN